MMCSNLLGTHGQVHLVVVGVCLTLADLIFLVKQRAQQVFSTLFGSLQMWQFQDPGPLSPFNNRVRVSAKNNIFIELSLDSSR